VSAGCKTSPRVSENFAAHAADCFGRRLFIALFCQNLAICLTSPAGKRRSVGDCRDWQTHGSASLLPVCAVMSQFLLVRRIPE
jgi:hypothetical protein